MDLSDSCTSSSESYSSSIHQADGVDKVAACLEGVTLTFTPSPNVRQVDKVNEVTGLLGSITLADTPSKDDVVVVQNAVKYHNIEKSTRSSGTVQITSHARETSETETQQPSATSGDESFLREQLQSLECPFNWKMKNDGTLNSHDSIITRTSEKMEEISEEDPFQWHTFILLLIICYECFCKGDVSDSWAKQRACETYLQPSDSKGLYESFFQATRDALSHVVYACKCHLFFKSSILNEARQTLLNVCKYEDMDNPCKAAIWGIRASVSMEYGYEGTKAAMEYIKKALELDPKQGEWHFLLGKCLGRIRRIEMFNEIPTQEELKALENAAEMTKNPSHMIFLAQAYREASFLLFSINRKNLEPLKEKLDGMNERSDQLYREALALRGDCTNINIRCALGFCKLPYPYKSIKLAKECCDKALLLAPNNAMANHVAGLISEWYEADSEKAKRHYQMAGEQGAYGAFMDLYRLKYNEDQTYDPIPDFEFLLSRFTEKPRIEDIICQMGSFYLFIKDDLATAYRKYWSKVISENPKSNALKTHKCHFVRMRTPVNIYELVFDEARIRMKGKNCELTSDEDCKLFREIIVKYSEHLPELSQNPPKPRRKIVLEEAESRSRLRCSGRDGGRGGGSSRSRGGADGHRDSCDRYRSPTNHDSSCESRGRYHKRVGSHDSSTERRDQHYSKERNVGSSRYQRDSSNVSRSSQDKNWRFGPRDFDQIGEGKLTRHRDSSSSSVEGRSYPFMKNNDGHREARTYSVSSIESGLDLGGGRIRTESNSSVGIDTHRDWKEGCLDGRPRSKNNNEKEHWQTGEGSNCELKFGEKQDSNSNWGSWRTAGNRKHGFQRDEDQRQGYQRGGERRPGFHGNAYYEREEARQRNMNQDSRSRSSDKRHNAGESDAMRASAVRASRGEGTSKWQGSQDNSKRSRYKVKKTNFKLSWRNSTN